MFRSNFLSRERSKPVLFTGLAAVVLTAVSMIGFPAAASASPAATVMVQTQRMSDATLNSTLIGYYPKGAMLQLSCYKRGQSVKGYFSKWIAGGYDDLWYKTSDGSFVADVDVQTGSSAPITGQCTSGPTSVAVDTNAWFTLTAKNSNKVLDVRGGGSANGTAVQQYPGNGSNAQKWHFVATDSGYYRLVSALNGNEVLDVRGAGGSNGTKVQIWSWAGGTNQQWMPVDAGNGNITLRPRHVGRCLDVTGGSTASSVQLQIYDCNGTSSQQFARTNVGTVTPVPVANKLAADVDAFVNSSQNKLLDYHGNGAHECVDLFNFYQRDVIHGSFVSIDYAYQIWTKFPAGASNSYTKISPSSTPKKGDVAVWSSSLPYSGGAGHVAVVMSQVNATTISVFEQNAPRGAKSIVKNESTSYLLGYLRPNRA
ncbi:MULTISPECIES: RICIN domain-containing protein [unclassified Cryobacterium]|uniref:RICIN domain-containing protein n=1 Tax=unclassified Cryobacterium TaxID=2649013 RepID=UPI002AB44F52|nr:MULTISPECIES: RICIN domain-containing protein [unclassified Cryobacterium]MDY7542452.1 RICIN domain-containing protein [Cryobacterium sp. 5B3]MEB0001054.1 RICIN domain-containing protein [Cryobacterium sp. RTS3]MEB0267745.1 RICIN domain-containing protein [Cryobacterium sp. 10I5]MEB0276667.1 RICIN domain-containing protein [Cryobacterium sp. 5B3]